MTPNELIALVYDHIHEFRSKPTAIYIGWKERADIYTHEDAPKYIQMTSEFETTFNGIPLFEVRATSHLHLAR